MFESHLGLTLFLFLIPLLQLPIPLFRTNLCVQQTQHSFNSFNTKSLYPSVFRLEPHNARTAFFTQTYYTFSPHFFIFSYAVRARMRSASYSFVNMTVSGKPE